MAQDIQTPAVGSLLQEFFRLVGGVRPSLEEVVLPTVLVGDLSGSAPPVRRRHAAGSFQQTAAAAQNAFFELFTTDPNTIAVITDVWCFGTGANEQLRVAFPLTTQLAGGSTEVTPQFTDSRVAVRESGSRPAFRMLQVSQAGGVVANHRGRWLVPALGNAFNLHLEPKGWVIQAPTRLTFSNDVVAETMILSLEWDEYQLP